jgi:serine/threonine protein kinase
VTKDRTSSVARADSDGASTMDLSGRCVGSSYVLQHPIGQGATGTVWRGVDRASGEPVAVKLLHESLLRQPKLVTRFVQERTILLMLRHRNVVRVRDLFSVGETLGLVMDLVDGGSLRDHLRERGTVAAAEACRLAAQVAAALAEAHELGVIHRDLKPDNILLRVEGGRLDTRLTDFGVARILNTPSMTTPNAVVGTPHYMAPEAFHGSTASPATDVYALGVLLYELVSGRPPYDSDSIPDLMRRHMEGHRERRPGMPDAVWDLVDDCMASKPRLRPSAAEMVAALSDAARECAAVPALPRPSGIYTDPGSAYADDSAFYPNGLAYPRGPGRTPGNGSRVPGQTGPARSADGAIRSEPGRSGSGASRPEIRTGNAGPGRDGGDDIAEAVSLLPVPRKPDRGNAAPSWRWAKRPGVTMAIIAAAMVATAVATTAWNHDRSGEKPRDSVTRDAGTTPSGKPKPSGAAVVSRAPRPAATPADEPARPASRSLTHTRVPGKASAPGETKPRSPQPEARAYGPWQCRQTVAFDLFSRIPLVPKPCQMTGRDIQYQASLTAPGGGTGSISVTLQDAVSGRTVAGPKTCANLYFGGDASTRGCGPSGASPSRGRQYTVVMTYRYERNGRTIASSSKGSTFSW